MLDFLTVVGATMVAVLIGAGVLHALPKVGGRKVSEWLCAGFPLDLVVTYFTALPPIVGGVVYGWLGVLAAVVGQLGGLIAWEVAHELRHRRTKGRAQLLRATNAAVGTVPNLVAVFWTAWAVPIFWCARVAEYFVYAPLPYLVKFPKYDHREWVHVSRHKFEGLVGHDRIWCLYCDWMTGVWSLGTEMLRNVESFWCPVRFSSTAKCKNCAIDFPDLEGGWVDFDTNADAAAGVLREKYGRPGQPNAWFGHPDRVQLTVNGNATPHDREAGRRPEPVSAGANGNGSV